MIEPTHRTAAVAGIVSGIGTLPLEWLERSDVAVSIVGKVLWVLAVVVVIAPLRYLVFGAGAAPFPRTWLFDSLERRRYAEVAKRGFIWLVTFAATGTACGLLWFRPWAK
jgi:hypothetical protein